jgi:outer membrane receptor protein involved in Fe transport
VVSPPTVVLALALAQGFVTGIVRDTTGGVVAGASVSIRSSAGTEDQTITGPDGRFMLRASAGEGALIVLAPGFAEHEQPLAGSGEIEVVLAPAGLLETVTVTPLRHETPLGNVPASVNLLDRSDISASPALVADDVLRRIPSFQLFRRSSSLSSHPTTQGVSLRGIGPSGVSRTLVLVDGIPFNDPFGGWVYWTRVPLDSVDRIEIVDGSSSSLYGNYAMGGVINIVTSQPLRRTADLKLQYGSRNTPKADFAVSDVWGKVGVAAEGSLLDTEGFPIVIENERGVIDNNATVAFGNANVKLDYTLTPESSAFFRIGYFSEDRGNGKITEVNDTVWTAANGGVRLRLPDRSDLQMSVFADDSTFHSTFVQVPQTTPPRDSVRLTVDQTVPTDSVGGMVQWSKSAWASGRLSLGGDWRHVSGDSQEDVYNQAGPVVSPITPAVLALKRVAGGSQRSLGAFLQSMFTPASGLTITASARVDAWRNYDGHNLETDVTSGAPGPANNPSLPDRNDTVVSPRIAALHQLTDHVRVWGDFGTGFRAPTLNELYRSFSVGATRTLANPELGPERLKGGELGISVAPVPTVIVRSTYYDNRVKDPVANVTIGANLAQRQNLGRTRVRGLQTDVEATMGEFIRVSGGYLLNDAKVVEFAANPALVGLYLPQVPRHKGSFQVSYANPRLLDAAFGIQAFGRQYEDDLNSRIVPGESEPGLPPYAIIDLSVARSIGRNFVLFAGIQNLLDTEYIAFTQPTTTGSPRLYNVGVRMRWAGQ